MFDKIVTLEILFRSFLPEEISNFTQPPNSDPIITGLLSTILMKIGELNNNQQSRVLIEADAGAYNKYMNYFPAIVTRYK